MGSDFPNSEIGFFVPDDGMLRNPDTDAESCSAQTYVTETEETNPQDELPSNNEQSSYYEEESNQSHMGLCCHEPLNEENEDEDYYFEED